MRLKRLSLVVVSICLVLMFVSLSLVTEKALAQQKTFNWKMTSPFPAGHTKNKSIIQLAQTLGERTNGAVKITTYESTLGAPTDQWDMLKNNAIQISFLAEAYNVGRVPVISIVNLPFELPDMNAILLVANEWLKAGYLKEITDNFKVLYFSPLNLQHPFLRNKKVTTLEDLKGLKMRSVSGVQGQVITALGATGVSMSGGETYMALQTGVIDGTITGIDNVVDRKFYEVCKYGMELPLYAGIYTLAMNKETWNSLPADFQKLIEQMSQDISISVLKTSITEEKAMWETIIKRGVEVYTISPEEKTRWKKATTNVADKYVQDWTAKGYPVKEALEMMRKMASK